jgi:uncharacterized protein YdhG (YjbR/CyaY superfamily)
MAMPHFDSVDEYLSAQPKATQRLLRRVRVAIRKTVPGGVEGISYGIPTVKLHGRFVLAFAGWKAHYSLYPSNARLVAKFKRALAPYEVDKGTIRFPLTTPVPAALIEGIARFRVAEVKAKAGAKRTVAREKKR